jgi:putative spermidine/putrescine transport system substrate-binding protein
MKLQHGMRNNIYDTVNGKPYGVPIGRGANLLQYNDDVTKGEPKSWDVVWETNSPYKGKITAYDAPIYIADAAVYLKYHKPELGIQNPSLAATLLSVHLGKFFASSLLSQT